MLPDQAGGSWAPQPFSVGKRGHCRWSLASPQW